MGKAAIQHIPHLHDLYIAGRWQPATGGQQIQMIEPSTGEVIGTIACGTAGDIDRAVIAARNAFEKTWRLIAPAERGRMMARLAALILQNEDELTDIEARDTGKPLSQARRDIKAAARYFEFYAGACDKIHGEIIPYEPGYLAMVLREPLGVTGHILPWNYPAQQFGRTLGPALAAGNAVVLKPAEDACLSILRMTELSHEAGFPAGVINVVPGRGNGAGSALAGHAGIDFISFTGSPEVGTKIQELAAANHIGCTLELGGKSPQIIFEDADLDAALDCVVSGILQNTGQTCSASSRTLVHESILDEFTDKLTARFAKVSYGHHERDLQCGPLISAKQRDRVTSLTQAAIEDGAPVLFRVPEPDDLPEGGFYFAPIVFGPVNRNSNIARDEVFGPVLAVMSFKDEADAIALANGTDYGLIAAVWSKDSDRLIRVAREMRCGQVFMNNYGAGGGVELPFGGVKRSGHGREKGMEAINEFSAVKTIVHKHG
ncbi:MAG: aldehyde dehydrogenase [Rhizobiales bacterium]|nr:aldehyde dehydrogenase [Hyphomicrobiales bacterium]MBA68234.1 aldehyde dehydrogenase [Hyphomicrobiales bacterium]